MDATGGQEISKRGEAEIERRKTRNERKFSHWEELSDGGRKYWSEITGKLGFKARYVKETNIKEETVRFYQEIYDTHDDLVEVHEKFPVNLGHRRLAGGKDEN